LIAQVMLYFAALGVAISLACHATGENHERAELRQLPGELAASNGRSWVDPGWDAGGDA
jgi:hypothetical protein